jgi:hypothetical protein
MCHTLQILEKMMQMYLYFQFCTYNLNTRYWLFINIQRTSIVFFPSGTQRWHNIEKLRDILSTLQQRRVSAKNWRGGTGINHQIDGIKIIRTAGQVKVSFEYSKK